jgi:hypothetical protein
MALKKNIISLFDVVLNILAFSNTISGKTFLFLGEEKFF